MNPLRGRGGAPTPLARKATRRLLVAAAAGFGGVVLIPVVCVIIVLAVAASPINVLGGLIGGLFGGSGGCPITASAPVGGVPGNLIPFYQGAAAKYSLGPQGAAVLAAINQVETTFGQNLSTSSAGAVGWMQFEPSTWAQYAVTPTGAPAPNGPSGWNDPGDAIYTAANYLHASGAPGNWQAAIFSYNHAAWYVNKVLTEAQGYYAAGLSSSKNAAPPPPQLASVCAAGPIITNGYANPLARIQNLNPERIDMGVDYSGTGPILAIGAGRIIAISNSGWPNGTFIEEHLMGGKYAGKNWYDAEDITPLVHPGQIVKAGEPIGTVFQGGSGIEIGWSEGDGGNTIAAQLGQIPGAGDAGGWSTAAGISASNLLHSLGAPAGVMQAGGPHGTMPAGYP